MFSCFLFLAVIIQNRVSHVFGYQLRLHNCEIWPLKKKKLRNLNFEVTETA